MRWGSKLLALAATGAWGANALDASIFTFASTDETSNNAKAISQEVPEEVAQLILELRMGSSLGSVLGKVQTDTIDRMNSYSGSQPSLFGGSLDKELPQRSFIFLEGLGENIGSKLRKHQAPNIFVPQTSSSLVDDALVSLIGDGDVDRHCTYHANTSRSQPKAAQSIQECLSRDPILSHGKSILSHEVLNLIRSMEAWGSNDFKTTGSRLVFKAISGDDSLVTKTFNSIFHDLNQLVLSENREITVLLLTGKESTQDLPRVSRRDVMTQTESHTSTINIQEKSQRSSQESVISSVFAPVCHASNSSCVDATNNCSGHGYCYLKYGSGDESTSGNCYACRCQQTVQRNSDGTTQKFQWGGSACQKKDISSPFFLIAGVSVLAILMVSSAVGMLFSMGQEELPSVIGAGVGATKSQS
ncbi:hypothetical protein N7462_008773 [Penicillium macrosclerotiorum]|uniref:uncharacterized protein n=1 Tax=Penicillium macrosclerotiorum TaxID=303699 RepID=UPI002549108F|nr:uncharacterized protein N7462_008773 [Penicillium macrosclerotiorum]KAJ5675876.1 hypothetical protein N7462_008773 [Penicillium macrosclerotiorum]